MDHRRLTYLAEMTQEDILLEVDPRRSVSAFQEAASHEASGLASFLDLLVT